jgi:hypothetical protein
MPREVGLKVFSLILCMPLFMMNGSPVDTGRRILLNGRAQ